MAPDVSHLLTLVLSTAHLSGFSDASSAKTSQPKKSVLDSVTFAANLREAGIHIEERQIESFYHELHRQCYPNLQDCARRSQDCAVDLSSDERMRLKMLSFVSDAANDFVTTASAVRETTKGKSGKSIRLEIQLVDGESVETIISIISSKGNPEGSVVVSSQVGSSVECVHPRSAKYVRDLSAAEIVEQVVHAARVLSGQMIAIRNVAFMGSGEPLHNYHSVLLACQFLEKVFRLKKGRITISTVGITPRIHDLRRDLPGVILAIHLHAPTNELRQAILPGFKFGLVGLFEALDQFMSKSEHDFCNERYEKLSRRRTVMIEYLMGK